MKIEIKHKISGDLKAQFKKMNKELFMFLNPRFIPLKIDVFEEISKNSIFRLKVMFFRWDGVISEYVIDDNESYFVDEGVKLPFPLKKWRHKHILKKIDNELFLIEDVEVDSYFIFRPFVKYFFRKMLEKRGDKYRVYFSN
ncbi:hypothetical protein JXR93_09355 [bacterium]|nr:hypothetical protein [bacterium]